jgi:hypothetical protein
MISKCKKMSTFVNLTRGQARALPVILRTHRGTSFNCSIAFLSFRGEVGTSYSPPVKGKHWGSGLVFCTEERWDMFHSVLQVRTAMGSNLYY